MWHSTGKTGLAAQQQNRLRKTLIMPAETSGKEVWSARYQTLDSVRPHFISAELAATVLRCGKGLIFLRYRTASCAMECVPHGVRTVQGFELMMRQTVHML